VSRANRLVNVERHVWVGILDTPKGGKGRSVPMTDKLAAALAAAPHLRGARVLLEDDGGELMPKVLWVREERPAPC
jgi:hypothetical protein